MFGTPTSSPAFGTPSSTPSLFGTPSSTPAFGTPSSTPVFGTPSSTPAFGAPSSAPAFGAPSSTPAFGAPSSTPAFGAPSSTPAFGTPSSTPAFGTPSASAFSSNLFQQPQQQQQSPFSPFPQQQQQQQQQQSPFGGFGQPQATPPSMFNVQPQITTQMAPVAPISLSLADRDIQAIIDAYKEEPANQKYAYRHLLLSVIDPAARVKPVGASDIMWAEAMGKLEGMGSADRERLWPQLVQGFKDLSNRLKIQDETIASDEERLRVVQNYVKQLQRHLQAVTLPSIQRKKHKEQELQRRLLRVMRIVEALEGKGIRVPLMKGEVELSQKLSTLARQLKGPTAELPKRVHNLLAITRVNPNVGVGLTYLPASARIHEESLTEMQEVLQQETEAISRLGNVLKKDIRDMEIIMSEDTDMIEDGVERQTLKRLQTHSILNI